VTDRFFAFLLDHVDLLGSFPNLGPKWRKDPAVRRLLHTPFHVYYRVQPQIRRIEILHIHHVSRLPPRL
jgi:plasmid stabilization system protein ParE